MRAARFVARRRGRRIVAETVPSARVYTQGRGGSAPARAAQAPWPPKLAAPAPGESGNPAGAGQRPCSRAPAAVSRCRVGEQGVLMVDTGVASMSDKVIKAVESLARGKPLRHIINTSHRDELPSAATTIAPTGEIAVPRARLYRRPAGRHRRHAPRVGRLDVAVLNRMSAPTGATALRAEDAGRTTRSPRRGSAVQFQRQADHHHERIPGTSDGNNVVRCSGNRMIVSSGDLFDLTGSPDDRRQGGRCQHLGRKWTR